MSAVSLEAVVDRLAASSAETDRKLAESLAETRHLMAASSAETDRKIAASEASIAASIAAIEHSVKNMTREFGSFGNRLGQLTELVVVPGIRLKMNALGHSFQYIAANKKVKAGGKIVAEVDVFLHNGAEAMAVEVKTMLFEEDVNEHVKRLKTLRRCEERMNIKNKALYGAVVGLVVDPDAREIALSKGLYVVEIEEDLDSLAVECPRRKGRW